MWGVDFVTPIRVRLVTTRAKGIGMCDRAAGKRDRESRFVTNLGRSTTILSKSADQVSACAMHHRTLGLFSIVAVDFGCSIVSGNGLFGIRYHLYSPSRSSLGELLTSSFE